LTHFAGSVNYCSPEMLGIIGTYTSGHIDLYYNDVHCLRSTINFFNKNSKNNDSNHFD